MKSTPFLATIPQAFMKDSETRKFFEYLINYVSDVQQDTSNNQTELSQQLNELYSGNENLVFTDDIDTDDSVTINGSQYRTLDANGGVANAIAGDFVSASNRAAITLEDYASDNDFIKVANADGSNIYIRGYIESPSGPVSSMQSSTKGAVYDFQFSAASKRWRIV